MARTGDVMEDPTTGERIALLKNARDTDGELLRFEYLVPPRTPGPPLHVHQEERFVEVLSGSLKARLGREERNVATGGSLVVPPGTPHTWRNDGAEEVRMLVEIRPALRMEDLFETTFDLARDGKTDARGVPRNPLQAVATASEYADELRLVWPPFAVQRTFFGLLVPVGRLLGYEGRPNRGVTAPGNPRDEGAARVFRSWR